MNSEQSLNNLNQPPQTSHTYTLNKPSLIPTQNPPRNPTKLLSPTLKPWVFDAVALHKNLYTPQIIGFDPPPPDSYVSIPWIVLDPGDLFDPHELFWTHCWNRDLPWACQNSGHFSQRQVCFLRIFLDMCKDPSGPSAPVCGLSSRMCGGSKKLPLCADGRFRPNK